MKVVVVKNYDEISFQVAQLIADQIINKKNSVLGLATGSTPIGVYQELIGKFQGRRTRFF